MTASLLYLVLAGYTLFCYGYNVSGSNRYLLYSWVVESTYALILMTLVISGIPYDIVFDRIYQVLSVVNLVTFIMRIFLIKTLQIYMDEENRTP